VWCLGRFNDQLHGLRDAQRGFSEIDGNFSQGVTSSGPYARFITVSAVWSRVVLFNFFV